MKFIGLIESAGKQKYVLKSCHLPAGSFGFQPAKKLSILKSTPSDNVNRAQQITFEFATLIYAIFV